MTRRLRIQDDLDAGTMTTVRVLFEELAAAEEDIALDVSNVSFIDSSGVGGLVFLYKRLNARGRRLEIAGLSGQPRQLLDHLKLTPILAPDLARSA
ncbi:STAS domain-containing protein [Rhabdaerophilum sp. SD176]|jgi:anti-anti-sigma factor|uniref:STAS domain-containing protein n=1 Tax=Rhabdaerophilum sp. SD176 TaxID=2983548 RepID=UPI0022C70314|nr:STAS domain-containing protein [Rhabdaerophilum sp. SD176]MCZ8187666.1 STAS domain-containing protein [Beijerinckiaceae bacterium]